VVGIVNTLIGIVGFPVLYYFLHAFFTYNILLVLNWGFNTGLAFVLHRFITFQSCGIPYHETMRFLILSLVILGINLAIMNIFSFLTVTHPVLAQFLISIVLSAALMVLNYVGLSRLVFKK
jgi:putative flippase GtrA